MVYKAYSDEIAKLKSLPETGMGYQVIDAQPNSSSYSRRFVVYNSQVIVPIGDVPASKTRLFSEGFRSVFNRVDALGLVTSTITLVSKRQILEQRSVSYSHIVNAKRSSSNTVGAKESPREWANGTEVFVRLSAYEDDIRIDTVNKRLIEGSYATTQIDYLNCVATDDPVDRYALPNDEIIQWAFYIKPKDTDILQRGIVQPANGHEGGGIEVYFDSGTARDTYFDKRAYGK